MSAKPDPQLLQRINEFMLSDPAADVSFASKLADEHFWTLGHATQVEQEYRRFLYLTRVAGHKVCPSKDVDAAWHLHLTQTHSYQRFCSEILGEFLHHTESKGTEAELHKHKQMYKETLVSYQHFFSDSPPAHIWPAAKLRFALTRKKEPEASWKWPFALEHGAVWTIPFVLVSIVMGCIWVLVLHWPILPAVTGPWFIKLYLLLLVGSVSAFELYQWIRKQAIDEAGAVDTYEAAWLCGGRRRVFSTALASLVKRGVLFTSVTRSSPGVLTSFYKRVRQSVDVQALPPVEQICLRAMPEKKFSLKTMAALVRGNNDLQRQANNAASVIQHRLENAGMIHRNGEVDAGFGTLMLVLCLLLTAAVARFVHGVQAFLPVAYLALLIVANVVLLAFYLRTPVVPTARGRKVVDALKAANASLKRNTADSLPLFALGFAIFGVSSVSADPGFDAFKRVLGENNRNSGGGGGCSGGGGCGGGGGGGGCGGGGCGG